MQRSCSLIAAVIIGGLSSLPALAIEVGPEFTLPGNTLGTLDEPFVGSGRPSRFSAAACGAHFLVVWGASDGGIYAARMTLGGELAAASPMKLADGGSSPSVASNGSNCLVVWYAPETLGVLGVRLALDGSVIDSAPLSIAPGSLHGSPPPYDRLDGTFRLDPQVASNGRDYLVSFRFAQIWSWGWVDTVLVSGDDGVVREGLGRFIPIVFEPASGRWATAWNGTHFLLASSLGGGADAEARLGAAAPGELAQFGIYWSLWGNPVSVASGAGEFLVLFNGGAVRPDAPVPGGLKAARFSSAEIATGVTYGSSLPGGAESVSMDPSAGCCVQIENACTYEGRAFAVVWLNDSDAATTVLGAMLPANGGLATPTGEHLFEGIVSTPALTSSGRGVSLLVYATPSAADASVEELRGRLLLTDSTRPAITVPAPVAATATTRDGAVVKFTASAQDDYAGALTPACFPASGSRFPPGTTRVSCMAVDVAGNVGVASFDVTVTFAWSGVLQPLSADGSSIFKSRRALPVKFRLTGASASIVDLPARLVMQRLSDGLPATDEEVTSAVASARGDAFRYDAEAGQYVLDAPVDSGTWLARILMDDGVERSVRFSVRK